MNERLPNLIVIGAMKCGTTSIHDYLDQHPDIFMSKKKELNYFIEENYSKKSLKWYKQNFASNLQVAGESSPGYTQKHLYLNVPERMFNLIPDAKLIYIIRNPIERFRSHIQEAIALGNRKFNFDPNKELKNNLFDSNYTKTGMYAFQLEAYLKWYSLDHIKVITLEELDVEPVKTMNSVFDFLKLDKIDSNYLITEKKNSFKEKFAFSSFGHFVHHSKALKLLRNSLSNETKKNLKSNKFVSKSTKKKVKRVELSEELTYELKQIYFSDLSKLESMIGEKISSFDFH